MNKIGLAINKIGNTDGKIWITLNLIGLMRTVHSQLFQGRREEDRGYRLHRTWTHIKVALYLFTSEDPGFYALNRPKEWLFIFGS